MGYPMTYQRVLARNALDGDYEPEAGAKPLHFDPRPMIRGDLRRLERDSMDDAHLQHYSVVAGITSEQARLLLRDFFEAAWTFPAPQPSSGAQCSACGFRYFAHNGHIIPCPRCENERLIKLIDTPELEDFDTGVPLESAHQVKRWGEAHDRSKSAENWYWLVGYLAGKALRASITGDREKALHHTISTAAVLRNWHRAIQQDSTGAGIGQDDDLAALASPSPNGNVEKKP